MGREGRDGSAPSSMVGGPLALLAAALVACGSRTELSAFNASAAVDGAAADAGRTCNGATPVDTTILVGAVPPCEGGFAHPSVCCHAGPDEPTACTESQEDPFHPCGCDALTFPDPRTCCLLADPSECQAPPANAGASGQCSYPCGPGAYPPDEEPGAGPNGLPACTDVPNGYTDAGDVYPREACFYCCLGTSCTTDVTFCGSGGGGSEGCPQPTQGCGACPPGWVNAQGIPDLCCLPDAGSVAACFSQAAVINSNK